MTRLVRLWSAFSRRLGNTPLFAVVIAATLMLASLALALQNEHMGRLEKVRQVEVQARILAGSVAGALAFEDAMTTREYVNALRANPEIQAAAAYDQKGRMVAGFVQAGAALPQTNRVRPAVFKGSNLTVTARVVQGESELGSVYLRAATEGWARSAMRYLGIALVVIMACLLVAVLGASYASVSEAHGKLQQEIKSRVEAEEALRQAQKMEAMGQLTGGVAHDFNNLLMVASSGLDLMERTTDPVRRERLKQGIRQAIDRGASLTQQLLAFARRSPLHPKVFDPGKAVLGMQGLLERSLREDIRVHMDVAPDLWRVEADPSQLEVAVLNIALNARDAMPNGGDITLRLENQPGDDTDGDDRVRLTIADTGQGIAPELLDRVFEPFFTTKRVGDGTGLGLSQVYGFARASGGTVSIQSESGAGTTIELLMPRTHKALPLEEVERVQAAAAPDRRRRVLLVEDDDSVASVVSEMLMELGYGLTRVPTAAAALDILDRDRFDIVFSDMVMPGEMNGLELAREIGRRRPDLPVLLTTGYSAAVAAAAAEGMRLLVKPYRIDALAAELNGVTAQRRSA